MEQKDFEQIIEDYNFACQVERRYDLAEYNFKGLYDLFRDLGYHCYNFIDDEVFDIEIGDFTLTCFINGGIAKYMQVWYDGEWHDTTIEDFKNNLGLAMLSHTIYKNEFYKDHDHYDVPVCFDEFLQNEWEDEEIKDYYIKQIKTHKGE